MGGGDKLFKRRKARIGKHFKRNEGGRKGFPRILIVCEGEKTEVNYFSEIRAYYKIRCADVIIDGTCDSSPKSILEYAENLHAYESKRGSPYSKIYCVFDEDDHASYQATLDKIKRKKGDIFVAINSSPCFEFWYLLHKELTTKTFATIEGHLSAADQVIKALKKHIPDYGKSNKGMYDFLRADEERAKQYAEIVNQEAIKSGTLSPFTLVHYLVEDMKKLQSYK